MTALEENLGFIFLCLVFIGFCLLGARGWKFLHPQKRLAVMLGIGAGLLAIVVALINPPWAGRWVLGIVIAGFAGYGGLYYMGRRQHARALDSFAVETGMVAVRNQDEENKVKELVELRKWLEPDLYKWKAAGQYPALVQKRGPWTLVIRTPLAVDFELNAPDYTCFSYIRKIPINTLIVQEYAQQKTKPKKIFETGDLEFDKRYCITGVNSQDAEAVFTKPVREYLKGLSQLPGWVRFERFGIYYFMPGSVASKNDIDKSLAALDFLASHVDNAIEEGKLTEHTSRR